MSLKCSLNVSIKCVIKNSCQYFDYAQKVKKHLADNNHIKLKNDLINKQVYKITKKYRLLYEFQYYNG